jgi:Rps23 Pro-64 3,4-dihydroxylase Tpa1-like proline 4-hydroxylase
MFDTPKIIDNFLPFDVHLHIKEYLIGKSANFSWFLNDDKSADNQLMDIDSLYNFQFTHNFYRHHRVTSNDYEHIIFPIIEVLKPLALISVKSNLTTITPSLKYYGWHVDYDLEDSKDSKHLTAVYYVNSNNGKTIFKSGVEVESVENRIVIFNGDLVHSGTSCTDSKVRCVININYISLD